MSWSIIKVGKPAAVAAAVHDAAKTFNCEQPEESIKNAAIDVILRTLSAYPENLVVKVEAHGNQRVDPSKPDEAVNFLNLVIVPQHGLAG